MAASVHPRDETRSGRRGRIDARCAILFDQLGQAVARCPWRRENDHLDQTALVESRIAGKLAVERERAVPPHLAERLFSAGVEGKTGATQVCFNLIDAFTPLNTCKAESGRHGRRVGRTAKNECRGEN